MAFWNRRRLILREMGQGTAARRGAASPVIALPAVPPALLSSRSVLASGEEVAG